GLDVLVLRDAGRHFRRELGLPGRVGDDRRHAVLVEPPELMMELDGHGSTAMLPSMLGGMVPRPRAFFLPVRILLVLCAWLACSHAPDGPPPRRAFYFWRTTFSLSAAEQKAITDLHVDAL